MVFRRDNKVDSFQRQMNALRSQIGGSEELDEPRDEGQMANESQLQEPAYRSQSAGGDQDAGAYSFGSYPAQAPPGSSPDDVPDLQAPPEMPAADDTVSVVARDTVWKGDIESQNSIQVFGRVEGTLNAREDVWIAEGAEVDATINAQRVIVGGAVSGSIQASARFEALPKGQINADVTAPISVVHEGAVINGNFRVGSDGAGESGDRGSSPAVIQRRTRTGS